jgi:tetratricopeptide (TPR) repeat protein
MNRPLCFVLMPFGEKKDPSGITIDFDAVYEQLIKPAVLEAGMDPLRADEEQVGGIIHKPMFERLVLCEYAVADLTTANANVFYELGVRHAVRPYSTVLLFSETSRLPFDLGPMRGLRYRLEEKTGKPEAVEEGRKAIVNALEAAKELTTDSPLFQLLDGMQPQLIDREKTDVFRERVLYSQEMKERLTRARELGAEAVAEVGRSLGKIQDVETGILVDLLLSYRAVKDWNAMIDLVGKLPEPLKRAITVREQLAFALNRAGRSEDAERVLLDLIEQRGRSSETNGLLGRVYKDRWEAAVKRGEAGRARGELKKAIKTYLEGFEADWRDAYPGVNAVTLMEVSDPPDPRRERLIPVVTYAVERRVASGKPDYWDHATLLELYVLGNDQDSASSALSDALATIREPWEPETTARNLGLIREARARRGKDVAWIEEIERNLAQAAGAKR